MKKLSLLILLVLMSSLELIAQTSVYIRGTGYNYSQSRQVQLDGQNVACGNSRGLCLTIINGDTHQHVSSTIYDTYGSISASDNLAIALNNLQRGQIGILTSYDAWENGVTENLKNAARRLGLYKLGGGIDYSSRRPYAAIFRGSGITTNNIEPNHIAYEVMQSRESGAEKAVIATWLIEDAFIGNNITNALVAGNGSISGASVLVDDLGNVGIGTSSPTAGLEVKNNEGIKIQSEVDGGWRGTIKMSDGFSNTTSRDDMLFSTHGGFMFKIDENGNGVSNIQGFNVYNRNNKSLLTVKESDGNVGIGTTTPDSKLTVAGNIHAQEVKVTIAAGADFVFEDNYKLPSLEKLESFIKTNKHLPEIASEKEMQNNGLQLAEMNIKLLQKIEEVTLYTIEQEKQLKSQKVTNKELKERLLKLEQIILKE